MHKISLPEILIRITDAPKAELQAHGKTILDALQNLCVEHEYLKPHLFHDNGELKNHFLVAIDGSAMPIHTEIGDETTIELLLATSGGINDHPGELTKNEVQHYARHIVLPGVGRKGQSQLKASKVLIIGTGGLGSPVALYLAAAGVGVIGLIDFDVVEVSNLQRQIIHGYSTLGELKVESAKSRLRDINNNVVINTYTEALDVDNAIEIIGDYDLVIDGTDNFSTRYLINDVCVMLEKPLVSGSIQQFEGQVSVYNYRNGPCYRCAFPNSPPPELAPNCDGGGVIGVLPGVIGTIQATEAIKILLGIGEVLAGRLLRYSSLSMRFTDVRLQRREECEICSEKPSVIKKDYQDFVCGGHAVKSLKLDENKYISSIQLQEVIEKTERDDYTLLDVRDPGELEICALHGAYNIPLNEISVRLKELDRKKPHYILCHHSERSEQAADILLNNKFSSVFVLKGGIASWASQIQPDMPVY